MRATIYPFPSAQTARSVDREKTPWFQLLNGKWQFKAAEMPENVTLADIAADGDRSNWNSVEVPGNWTLQGYGAPQYTNVQMPFPDEPPFVPQDNLTGIYAKEFSMPADCIARFMFIPPPRCTLPTSLRSEVSKTTIPMGASSLRPRSVFHANPRKVGWWRRNCSIQKEKLFSKLRFDRLPPLKTAPQKEEKIKLKLPAVTVQAGQEAFLYLRFYAAAATTWCKSGHGVVLFLKPGFEKLRWFGRNPFENYSDRKRAALVDLYESTVTDQYVPYIMPQEHGNHTDVRWLSLGRESARLLVVAAGPMEFSASHYTAQDIDSACHTHDLHPRAEVILNLDYRQRGLGTESCGPGPLEQYKIKPGRYAWSYTLQPLESLKSKSVCK